MKGRIVEAIYSIAVILIVWAGTVSYCFHRLREFADTAVSQKH